MSDFKLPQELILGKRELAEICGGKYVCSCWNEDGTRTIVSESADSPEHCAALCKSYWDSLRSAGSGSGSGSGSICPTLPPAKLL